MSGFDVRLPRRLLVDEIITTGTAQKTGVTGWTGQGAVPRYNSWANPLPPSSSVAICFFMASSSVPTTVTVFSSSAGAPQTLGQPDYPRAVRVIPSTSAFNAAASSSSFVVINGTNQFGATVSDSISMGNGVGPIDGIVAFKTITSVVLPATSSGQTPFTIGLSNTFGLDRIAASVAAGIHSAVNGTIETTWPIIGAASTSGNSFPAFALPVPSRGTAKFATAATSSAGALVEIFFVPQDTTQGHI